MTHLAVVGPYLVPQAPTFSPGLIRTDFLRYYEDTPRDVSPAVILMYSVASSFAARAEIRASFPVAPPGSDPRRLWVEAVSRLASADAVFAIYDEASNVTDAIALETFLARQMNLPLLLAVSDGELAKRFGMVPFPVIDAQLGSDVVEQALEDLFSGEDASAKSLEIMS